MRRRLIWGLTAMLTMLAIPAAARSEDPADGSPKVHVAGIGLGADPGGPRSTPVPRLVRGGSDLRAGPVDSEGPG